MGLQHCSNGELYEQLQLQCMLAAVFLSSTHACCLQDAESLYMGLEHCPNGELYEQLQARGPLSLCDAVQYAAEVVDILAYLRCVIRLLRVVKQGLGTGAEAAAAAARVAGLALRAFMRPLLDRGFIDY
jgi:hypothetical protein